MKGWFYFGSCGRIILVKKEHFMDKKECIEKINELLTKIKDIGRSL